MIRDFEFAEYRDLRKLLNAKVTQIEEIKYSDGIDMYYIHFSNGLVLTSECREYNDSVFYLKEDKK